MWIGMTNRVLWIDRVNGMNGVWCVEWNEWKMVVIEVMRMSVVNWMNGMKWEYGIEWNGSMNEWCEVMSMKEVELEWMECSMMNRRWCSMKWDKVEFDEKWKSTMVKWVSWKMVKVEIVWMNRGWCVGCMVWMAVWFEEWVLMLRWECWLNDGLCMEWWMNGIDMV